MNGSRWDDPDGGQDPPRVPEATAHGRDGRNSPARHDPAGLDDATEVFPVGFYHTTGRPQDDVGGVHGMSQCVEPGTRDRAASPGGALWPVPSGDAYHEVPPRRRAIPDTADAGTYEPARRTVWRPGAMPAGAGVGIITFSALAGLVATVAAHGQPADSLGLLGVSVIAGATLAGLLVRPGSVYLIIPVPAVIYALAATAIGLIRDPAALASHTALALHATQWAAAGFTSMALATGVAIVLAASRPAADWLIGRRITRRQAAHRGPGHSRAARGRSPRGAGPPDQALGQRTAALAGAAASEIRR